MNKHHHHTEHADERLMLTVTIITLCFVVIEVVGGILSSSLILIVDAGHMLIDAFALGVALLAMKLAKKPGDARRSYGYQRSKVIAAFFNSITLLATTIWIMFEAVNRILHPIPVAEDMIIILATLGAAVNLGTMFLLNKSAKKDINIKSALIHIAGDLLGYLAAIIAAVLIYFTGWTQIDPIISILFAILISRSALQIARDSLHVLMEGAPSHIENRQIIAALKAQVQDIINVHHIHIWFLTHENLLMTAHIRVKSLKNSHSILNKTKKILKSQFNIAHATIELEETKCSED
jgi:cobalt-zinc-cadmium efflux system protein